MGAYQEFYDDDERLNEMDLTVPQTLFLRSKKKFPLFVAGFGSGKSQCMCISALNDIINFPGANVAVYAPTYDLLNLVIMQYIQEMLTNGGFAFTLNNGSHTFNILGYGKIICRSMDNPGRIVAYQVFRSHCDELDTLKEDKADMVWKKIIARNRQKIYIRDENGKRQPLLDATTGQVVMINGRAQWQTHMNRVSAYTTPEGYQFAYKRWVKMPDPEGHYEIFQASTYSNAHNLPADYIPTLRASYPAELIDAYLEGKFTNLKSGRVYRKFNRVDNASHGQEIIEGERLHVGMDFNVEHMAAAICVVRQDQHGNDELHALDEIHDAYDTDDAIRILDERYPNNPISVYPDATGKKRSSSNNNSGPSKTDIEKLKNAGYDVVVNHSNPLIKDRVNCVNAVILNGVGKIRFFVDILKCPNLVDTFEKQGWDDNGMPDKKTGLDHMGDAIGYVICKLFPIVRQGAAFLKTHRRVR